MIYFGRFSDAFIAKALGVIQVIVAIIITSFGITITVKCQNIHIEENSEYNQAIGYVNNPWTTKYGAGIWMGLVMCIAGAYGTFADLKPHKPKYTYGFLVVNIMVLILGIVLIVFSIDVINWYDECKFVVQSNQGEMNIQDCPSEDKDTGQELYIGLLVSLILAVIITIVVMIISVIHNRYLFDDCCTGSCFRQIIYNAKGKANPAVNFKTKNTHEFDRVSIGPQQFSAEYDTTSQHRLEASAYV